MKRITALLLSLILVIGCGVVAVSADTTKINESLQQMMTAVTDKDKIEVHVWLYCRIDENEVFRQAIKECGYVGGLPLNMSLEEVYAYKAVYNRLVGEREAAVSSGFVEKLGIAEEDIIYLGKHPYVVAALTKAQIYEAQTYDEVESLSYVGDQFIEDGGASQENKNRYEGSVKEMYPFLYQYSELYYHRDGDGNIDWVLITGEEASAVPEAVYTVIGNRVVIEEQYTMPFGFGYGVYDVGQNTVKAIYSGMTAQYDGLEEAFDQYGCGRLIGDIDEDNEVTIIDATFIQRCETKMRAYPDSDRICPIEPVEGALTYYSDFNRDGERDILDVTCIQRCLVGLPYPVNN